ncbi:MULTISPECIES: CYTH domain-containing protein [Solibacillus]|uniref:CYTH domain-containing protein n=1 Tax=Solibacillus merdavium TaxID=2762218 RepID=A0ABR8XHV9_9BACL|nr:CYTH domain-containing protein [Solibacillus merdavium]MBD8031521.1 CYTH domain-containing protein [Solibacillus merdavium]
MTQHIEIEFKNIITKAQYEGLLQAFSIQPEQIIRQVNHYFDTSGNHLKELQCALRIREIGETIECTLKEKTSEHQHLETTDFITREQADQMLAGKSILLPAVNERLALFDIPMNTLHCYGTLTTDRVEIPYEGGLLVFDHSFYLHCDDYEVEYETNDEKIGKKIFSTFLVNHSIEPQPAQKKIVRFMMALNNQKG